MNVNDVHAQRNNEATCYIGFIHEKVPEAMLWELMSQVGRIDKVISKYVDKETV